MSGNTICCVCKKSQSDQSTEEASNFFSFPKTQQLKEKWIKMLNIKLKVIPDNYAVCSLHFLNSDIKIVDGVPTLKRTAVPLNKTIVQVGTAEEVLPESSTSDIQGVNKRVKHKMVPVEESDSSCQLLATDGADKSEPYTNEIENIEKTRSDDIPKKRKRMKILLDSDDEKESFLPEEIESELSTSSVAPNKEHVAVNNSFIKLEKRRKKIETKYQKALMKLHELIKCLDSIGAKFAVESFSRKILRAPKNSKLYQFFNQSDGATTEEINIEIVDDDSNIVNESNFDFVSKNVKTESTSNITTNCDVERKKFLKRKLRELARAAEFKQQKINELKLILKQKSDIIQDLEVEVANLKEIVTTPEPEHE